MSIWNEVTSRYTRKLLAFICDISFFLYYLFHWWVISRACGSGPGHVLEMYVHGICHRSSPQFSFLFLKFFNFFKPVFVSFWARSRCVSGCIEHVSHGVMRKYPTWGHGRGHLRPIPVYPRDMTQMFRGHVPEYVPGTQGPETWL